MGIYNLGGGGGAPELQAKEATPLITNAQQIILPDDGYDGLSKVTVNPMPTGTLKTPTVNSIGYVSSGVQTAGYLDTSATSGLQLSTQAAKTITPTTYSQTAVASGKYTTGAVTVAGDANLVASNIVAGKSIFGVSGSAEKYYYSETDFKTPVGSAYHSLTWNITMPFTALKSARLISCYIDFAWGGTVQANEIMSGWFTSIPNSSIEAFLPPQNGWSNHLWYCKLQVKGYNDNDWSNYNKNTCTVSMSGSIVTLTLNVGNTATNFRADATYKFEGHWLLT